MKFIQALAFILKNILNRKGATINYSLNYMNRKRTIDRNYMDYIRLATLELVAHDINCKGLEGAVAELGVYKGKFARYINQYFPNRKLFLFDTFEGFAESDIASEQQNTFSTGNQDFSKTSVAEVLARMPYPQQCVIKQGFFPKTAEGVNEEFVFVSLDADLYEPIYSGLTFFYPKLVTGGCIFIHDYNNDHYKGAKEAVVKFCIENKRSVLPLPDSAGTAVLIK